MPSTAGCSRLVQRGLKVRLTLISSWKVASDRLEAKVLREDVPLGLALNVTVIVTVVIPAILQTHDDCAAHVSDLVT